MDRLKGVRTIHKSSEQFVLLLNFHSLGISYSKLKFFFSPSSSADWCWQCPIPAIVDHLCHRSSRAAIFFKLPMVVHHVNHNPVCGVIKIRTGNKRDCSPAGVDIGNTDVESCHILKNKVVASPNLSENLGGFRFNRGKARLWSQRNTAISRHIDSGATNQNK